MKINESLMGGAHLKYPYSFKCLSNVPDKPRYNSNHNTFLSDETLNSD